VEVRELVHVEVSVRISAVVLLKRVLKNASEFSYHFFGGKEGITRATLIAREQSFLGRSGGLAVHIVHSVLLLREVVRVPA
jgi:hypothetical protein